MTQLANYQKETHYRNSRSWWISGVYVGDKVDVYSETIWSIATIKNITNKTDNGCKLHLHFDSYAAERDRCLKINYNDHSSYIIKPLNSYTLYHNYLKYSQLKPCTQKYYIKKCCACSKKCCSICKSIVTIPSFDYGQFCEDCCEHKQYEKIQNAIHNVLDKMDLIIINIIASYSIGIIVKCSNYNNCLNEIVFDNVFQLNIRMDCEMKNIHQYPISPYDSRYRSDIKYQNIYGLYRRIFCYECNNVIKTCYFCHLKDVFVAERTNGYERYMWCDNHMFCTLCKFPPESHWITAYNKCLQCGSVFCEKCCAIETCIRCIEFNNIYKHINYLNSLVEEKINLIKNSLFNQNKRQQEIKHEYNNKIINSFKQGTKQILSLCFELNYPTIINVPYSLSHAYKNVLAFVLGLGSYESYKLNIIRETNNKMKSVLDTKNDSDLNAVVWSQIEEFDEINKTKQILMN
eukprot:551936_1